MWDDSVAPETCIDFDAPHVTTGQVLGSFAAAMGFFVALYTIISISDPVKSNPVSLRSTVIPHNGMRAALGISVPDEEGDEEEED